MSGSGRRADDSGQVTLLLLGYVAVALAVILTGASVTAVHLARHRLIAVADGAALASADALDDARFYAGSGNATGPVRAADPVVPLSDVSVRTAANEYLANADTGGLNGVHLGEPTGTPDGATAEVTLVATVRRPLIPSFLGAFADVTIAVTSLATADRK